jgi:hypothetical protein
LKKKLLLSFITIILLVCSVIILYIRPFAFTTTIGTGDFRPYWSSSYLLAHGQDFADFSKIYNLERTLTGWIENYTMVAWFSPIGNLVLLPFTFFSFTNASYFWLLINIVIMFLSTILIWQTIGKPIWIPLLATFGFSMTLVSIYVGQVNTVNFFGLALFVYFMGSKRQFAAGISLVLTTIKPQLVILTLPLLLLDIIRSKQWRTLAGFSGALLGCIFTLFVFYFPWPSSFWKVVTSGMETVRATPSVNGILVVAGEQVWGKWVWLIVLALAIVIWWKYRPKFDQRTMIDASILVGLIVSPIGWSYDQVMLLFPILSVFGWMVTGSFAKKDAFTITLILIVVDILSFCERIFLELSDVWYFWVPMVVAVIYCFAWRRKQSKSVTDGQAITSLI